MADISVGSVSVDVVPDATGFARELKAKLSGISVAIGISVDTTQLRAQLEEVTRERTATINVNADTAAAEAQIDAVARSREAHVDIDTGGSVAKLATLRGAIGLLDGGGSSGGGLSGLKGLTSGAAGGISSMAKAIGPAAGAITILIPIVVTLGVALAGVTAALAVPLGAAGGGLTIFGILAGKAAGRANKIGKEIDDLRKKAKTLVDPAARKAMEAEADALEKTLTGSQRAFLRAKKGLSGAFDKLIAGKAGDALLRPLAAGMSLLAKVMPKLEPIIVSVSNALSDLIGSASKKVDGSGFEKFIASVAKLAGPAIKTVAGIIADIGRSLGALFKASGDTGVSALDSIGKAVGRLAGYLNSAKGQAKMQEFFQWLRDNGPGILKAIGQIGAYIGDAIQVMMKVGPPVIRVIGQIAAAISAWYTNVVKPTFTAVGQAFSTVGHIFTSIYNAAIGPALAMIVTAIGKVMSAFAAMLRGLSHVPGFGWAKEAAKKMQDAADKANGLANKIRQIPKTTYVWIKMDTSGVTSGLRYVIATMNKIGSLSTSVKVALHASDVGSNARGTSNWRGGLTWVGEEGPELINLQKGAQVIPTNDSMALAASASSPSSSGSMDGLSPEAIRAALDGMSMELELTGGNRAKAEFVLAGLKAAGRLK